MTDDEIIAVVTAHKEGKAIQGRWHDESQWWLLTQSGAWARFHQCDYRVASEPPATPGKLQPREWWIEPLKYGLCRMSDTASICALWHVREVIE